MPEGRDKGKGKGKDGKGRSETVGRPPPVRSGLWSLGFGGLGLRGSGFEALGLKALLDFLMVPSVHLLYGLGFRV